MADPERVQTTNQTPTRDADDRSAPKREVSAVSIRELFQAITLKKLMDDETPGSASLVRLREIEESLESPDFEQKEEAGRRLQEVVAAKEAVEAKAIKIETVEDLWKAAKIPDAKKAKLKTLAEDVDSVFAKSKNEELSDTELERVNSELLVLAREIGIRENAEGMEEALAKMKWLEASKAARQFVKERELYINPVEEYKDEFREGHEGKVLKLTDVPAELKDSKQNKLNTFKKHVAEELMAADKRKIEDLTSEDLVNRLKEVTYWQANMADLQGRKKWAGNENIEQLRDMLGRVEAQYQSLLEDRMVKDLTSKHGEDRLNTDFIRESVVKTLRDRRRFLRSEYDFDKGVPPGKRPVEMLEEEVYVGTKKIQKTYERHETSRSPLKSLYHVEGNPRVPGSLTPEQSEARLRDMEEKGRETERLLGAIGVDLRDSKTTKEMRLKSKRREWLEKAEKSLNTKDLTTFRDMMEDVENSSLGRMGRERSDMQIVLEDLKESRQYSKFMIKFKAYVERVGLREASSDWDFAIMMRQAKEEISRIHPDAGEKLDQWQEALFAPGLTSVDEKSFFEVMPKIMTQSRLEHEFSPQYANWEAMQVMGADGTKKVISVAAFHQLLQREDNAKRILNAITNGNDSMIHQILAEHIWGPGATLVPGLRISEGQSPKYSVQFVDGRAPITEIDVTYFDMDKGFFDSDNPENVDKKMSIEDFLDQSMWMTHYAKTLWSFSGDWEPFVRDFPADQLTQANKRLANIGQAFRDYGLDYGKFDMGYIELAKAGVLLQPFSTYKIADVVTANLRRMLFDRGIEKNFKKGDEYAGALADAIQKRAFISDKYNPVVAMRTVGEMRLMGNLPTGDSPADLIKREELIWDWFKTNQEILGRKGVLSLTEVQGLKKKYLRGENLNIDQEAWAVQLIEMDKLASDLVSQRLKLEKVNIPDAVLREIMDKQSLLTTGEKYDGPVNLETYLKNFEFSSIIDHAQLKKGTDPIDYKNYSEAKQAAAKLMTDVLSGSPTLEKINELYNTMKSYMPPDQLMAWFEEYMRTRVRLRTNQIVGYEIAMTDLELWKQQHPDLVRKGVHPPEKIMGINPATYKIKDERGDSWNVIGADGFKVTKKKMERGNHMWKTREIPGLSAKDIELEMKLYVGNRWLANKEVGHHIVENTFGLSQTINQFYKNRGWDVDKSKLAKFVKKWGSKGVILLRQHPLFDNPQWAFWSILNEFVEYGKEVGKEFQKEVVGGH